MGILPQTISRMNYLALCLLVVFAAPSFGVPLKDASKQLFDVNKRTNQWVPGLTAEDVGDGKAFSQMIQQLFANVKWPAGRSDLTADYPVNVRNGNIGGNKAELRLK